MAEEEKQDKGINITASRGQMLTAGGIIAAILTIQPLKEAFITREEGKAQADKINELQASIDKTKDELTRSIERNSDKVIERLTEAEERVSKTVDTLERRIESLESANRMVPSHRRSMNN